VFSTLTQKLHSAKYTDAETIKFKYTDSALHSVKYTDSETAQC